MNPFQVVKDFESALCDYTGAKYAVTTTSCTSAILLSLLWLKHNDELPDVVDCPSRTYVSVPMQIAWAGAKIRWTHEPWLGSYRLSPTPIIDSARYLSGNCFIGGSMTCISLHWSKHLSLGQGGVVLHDCPEADEFLRRCRFDGRREGVAPAEDSFDILGLHCYMSPSTAAEGLTRLRLLPQHNDPLPNDNYPDLSKAPVFAPYTVA